MRFFVVSGFLAWFLGGCGYQTGSLMPEGIQDVAVEVFGNDTLYRQAELTFTGSLSREIIRRTHATLRDPEDAQAIIRGRILHMPRVALVEDRNDRILEGGVIVAVEVRVEDAKTGAPIMPSFVVQRRAEHIAPRPETLQQALDEALRDAAVDAVFRIQSHGFLVSRG